MAMGVRLYFSVLVALVILVGCSSILVADQVPPECTRPLGPHGDWTGEMLRKRLDACEDFISGASGKGLAEAQFYQGRLLYLGGEIDRSIEKFEAAYNAGEIKAGLALGLLTENERYDSERSYREYYQEAAEAGDNIGKVVYALVLGVMTVDATPEEYQTAWNLLHEAADDGFAPADFYLGDFYNYTNPGELRDEAKAIEHYKLAAKGGVRDAVEVLEILGEDVSTYVKGEYRYPEVVPYSLILDRP